MANLDTFLIFGAGSGIAIAFVQKVIANNSRVILVNRSKLDLDQLEIDKNFVLAEYYGVDCTELADFQELIGTIFDSHDFQIVLIAQGMMLPTPYSHVDIRNMYECNVISPALILDAILKRPKKIKEIVLLGSIAGDRGKAKNPVYDSTKSAVEVLSQGYRQSFLLLGINLLLVKPGNISTRMTQDKQKNWTWVKPDFVANDIFNALNHRRRTIYSPWIWGVVMLIVKSIPEKLFVFLGLGNAN